ncbi:hypothetical protein LIT32_26015 (plasmid) [Bacillus sp. CMF21]|nr:hypothetical protein LIT32_26015 [Bacillus sp. CMF21]
MLDVSRAVHLDNDSLPFVHLMGTNGGASIRGQKGKLLTKVFDGTVDVDIYHQKMMKVTESELAATLLNAYVRGKK